MLAYDGSAFHGFAANPGVATVAGALDAALSTVTSTAVRVTCAGRTDAGVHARAQVVSFDAPAGLDTDRVRNALNKMIGPEIAVEALDEVTDAFDARFSAVGRTYRYRLNDGQVPDPLRRHDTWHIGQRLDLAAVDAAAAHLVGEHDFAAFCRKRMVHVDGLEVAADLTREVVSIEWRRVDTDVVEHWISATAFCHQMVRAITGTLVTVGVGRREPEWVREVLQARDRNNAGRVAPAHGLTFWSVDYGS